jgi:hypothetical protein
MGEARTVPGGERPSRAARLWQSSLTGFVKFVAALTLLDLCLGFAWGVIEGSGGSPSDTIAAALAPENPLAKKPLAFQDDNKADTPEATKKPDETPTAVPPKPKNDTPKPPDPTPALPKIVDDGKAPPKIVDELEVPDPTPLVEAQPPVKPKPPVQPNPSGDLFDFGEPGKVPPDVAKADGLKEQARQLFLSFHKSGDKAEVAKARQLIEQSIELYRAAAKKYPKDRSIQNKLIEANQMKYAFLKASPI